MSADSGTSDQDTWGSQDHTSPEDSDTRSIAPDDAIAGAVIGFYHLLQPIGHGGRTLGAGHPETASTAYGLAGVLALEGKRDESFVNLVLAVDHELASATRQGLETDDDLKSLRGDLRFAALVASMRQDAAAGPKSK